MKALSIVLAPLVFWAGVTTAQTVTNVMVTVEGTAGPWEWAAGIRNWSYWYDEPLGIYHTDFTPPTVITESNGVRVSAGDTLTISYLSGSVSVGWGWPFVDANGDTNAPMNDFYGGDKGNTPSNYMSPYPIYTGELVGTFATKGGLIVGTPFAIGNLGTFAVPTGATQLQLGVNDSIYSGNQGSWNIQVTGIAAEGSGGPSGPTETILHVFGGSPHDGLYPKGTLVEGDDGNFYGTTFGGGKANLIPVGLGVGTVFRISPSGTYTTLYYFGTSPNDGYQPVGGLVKGSDGNFYGTTQRGGTNAIRSGGLGTVFRITPSGSYTNLYCFPGYPGDGYYPQAPLIQGTDGNFYGTTYGGGTNGYGIVFRISPDGKEETVSTFVVWAGNGGYLVPGVVQGSDGNFYGTTVNGGTGTSADCFAGCGTVFRVSPSGTFTNLHSFAGYPNDGANPFAGLIQGKDGNFYGTTRLGGANDAGTVFRISPDGSETILWSFIGFPSDGAAPEAALVQGSDGNFYGTTLYAGAAGAGIVFRISPSGSYTNLYSFEGPPNDGYQPNTAALVQGTDGNFYGTTPEGGSSLNSGYGFGTVFKMTIPLCQPQVISGIAVTPNVLWPPNHKMVFVTIDYMATGNCGVARCELSATSNEPDTTATDIELIPGDPHHLYLRAERSGQGNGRAYTITITCTDTNGNTATQAAQVTVPHDLGVK